MRLILLKEGDRIHLKSKEGMYTVVYPMIDGCYISCKKWQAVNNYPKFIVKKWIKYTDIKCIAGGMNNSNLTIQEIKLLKTKGLLEQDNMLNDRQT